MSPKPARRLMSLRKRDLPSDLPGADLVVSGIAALEHGERTTEALLVAVAATRLQRIGLDIPKAAAAIENPNLALYAAVCEAGGGHSHYNALLRRLVSFMRAAEQVLPRRELVERAGIEPAKAGL